MENNKEIVISKEAISELVDHWCKSGEAVRIISMDVYEGIKLAKDLTRCLKHSIEALKKRKQGVVCFRYLYMWSIFAF